MATLRRTWNLHPSSCSSTSFAWYDFHDFSEFELPFWSREVPLLFGLYMLTFAGNCVSLLLFSQFRRESTSWRWRKFRGHARVRSQWTAPRPTWTSSPASSSAARRLCDTTGTASARCLLASTRTHETPRNTIQYVLKRSTSKNHQIVFWQKDERNKRKIENPCVKVLRMKCRSNTLTFTLTFHFRKRVAKPFCFHQNSPMLALQCYFTYVYFSAWRIQRCAKICIGIFCALKMRYREAIKAETLALCEPAFLLLVRCFSSSPIAASFPTAWPRMACIYYACSVRNACSRLFSKAISTWLPRRWSTWPLRSSSTSRD